MAYSVEGEGGRGGPSGGAAKIGMTFGGGKIAAFPGAPITNAAVSCTKQ